MPRHSNFFQYFLLVSDNNKKITQSYLMQSTQFLLIKLGHTIIQSLPVHQSHEVQEMLNKSQTGGRVMQAKQHRSNIIIQHQTIQIFTVLICFSLTEARMPW